MAADKVPQRRLGRGLDALLGQKPVTTGIPSESLIAHEGRALADTSDRVPVSTIERAAQSTLREISVAEIRPNHYQPRKEFKAEELRELRESIQVTGLLQPITVRPIGDQLGYELVAGERRLRAVIGLGWAKIPALVRDYDDRTTLTLALVENLQREDLNPIEEAEGYARLSGEFGLTQNEIAELVGKDRSTIANLLRVLHLPAEVRRMLEAGDLTLGHARPLLSLDDQDIILRLAKETVEHGLSVRSVEQRIRQSVPRPDHPKRGRPMKADERPAEVRHVEDLLRRRLQTDVSINVKQKEKGELRVQFYSYDDLNRLLELIGALE